MPDKQLNESIVGGIGTIVSSFIVGIGMVLAIGYTVYRIVCG